MAVPTAASVRDTNRYRPPTITGLIDLIDQQVRDRPGARALVVTGDRVHLSYGTLAALVDDVAARLRSTGLSRRAAVGLVGANTAEFVVALLAAARAGLVVAPIDPALPESQMSARLEALGARAILVGPTRRPRLKAIVYVVDGTVARVRAVQPDGNWGEDDRRYADVPVGGPLTDTEIATRLPTLNLHPGDPRPHQRGKLREYVTL